MQPTPLVTVVIVNWNGGDDVLECLASLRPSVDRGVAKVVMVDNDSKDGSRERAQQKFPDYTIFNSGGNLGFGKANNVARPHVTTPYVLVLNPDTLASEEAITGMANFLQSHPDVGAVGCRMMHPSGRVQPLGSQWFPNPLTVFAGLLFLSGATPRFLRGIFPTPDPRQSAYVSKLYGGCIMLPVKVMDAVGWFDERYFMYAEDVDLCRTVLAHGWKNYYLSEVAVVHEGGGTSKKAPSDFSTLMMTESIGIYISKYQGFLGHLGYRAAILIGASIRFVILGLLQALAAVTGKNPAEEGFSLRKQKALILWSLALRRAAVPTGPSSIV